MGIYCIVKCVVFAQRPNVLFPQVELELRAQVALFKDLTGHLPHHMDGHQHVHVLPGNVQFHGEKKNNIKT